MRDSIRQHVEILASLRSGKVRAVEAAVSGHMQSTGDVFGELRQKFPDAFAD
jgi:DNA-binding GntR family transcriptional regulator